jgi:hypothetical protein
MCKNKLGWSFLRKEASHGKAKYYPFVTKGDPEKGENAGDQEGYFFKPVGPRTTSDDC